MYKTMLSALLLSMGIGTTTLAANLNAGPPLTNPNDPCSPGYPGPPPFIPCDRAHASHHQGKHPLPTGKPATQRLYPAPDGKGDSCTRPWQETSTGKPYCPGDIVE